jgi:amidase
MGDPIPRSQEIMRCAGSAEVHELSLTALALSLRERRLTSTAVTHALLERIANFDPRYGSFVTVLGERALEQAARADREMSEGLWRGALHGVPLAVKDLCATTFAPTTSGMPSRRHFFPDHDATVVERLENAGAVLLGKLSMTEGAFSEHRPELPVPKNPWNADYWPGSSSSGSGVALALGFCYGALGSDTGGSIRYPAACTGVTGLKPTWGRVSRHGISPLAPTMDQIGPMAGSAADCAVLFGVIAGYDAKDPTTSSAPVADYPAAIDAGIADVRIGYDARYAETETDSEVVNALHRMRQVLENCGARIIEVDFPPVEEITTAWLPICAQEAAAVHRASFAVQATDYGGALSELIRRGAGVGPGDIAALTRCREEFRLRSARLFEDVELLLTPVLSRNVPTLAALAGTPGARHWIRRFTTPFNLTGQPTITIPAGFDAAGLPIGLQLVGRPFGEERLLQAGHAVQQRTDWHLRPPRLASGSGSD